MMAEGLPSNGRGEQESQPATLPTPMRMTATSPTSDNRADLMGSQDTSHLIPKNSQVASLR